MYTMFLYDLTAEQYHDITNHEDVNYPDSKFGSCWTIGNPDKHYSMSVFTFYKHDDLVAFKLRWL